MYSKEHKEYIKKIKINKILIFLVQITIITGLTIIWQFLADKQIINTFITSSPKEVIKTIINLYNQNNIFNHNSIPSKRLNLGLC